MLKGRRYAHVRFLFFSVILERGGHCLVEKSGTPITEKIK